MSTTIADLRRENIREQKADSDRSATPSVAPSILPVSPPLLSTDETTEEVTASVAVPIAASATNEEMKKPSNEGMSARVKVGTGTRRRERTQERAPIPTSDGWLDGILTQAKAGTEEEGKLSRLNVDIDEDLHVRLKTYCLRNRITLRKLVPVLLAAYLEKAEEL